MIVPRSRSLRSAAPTEPTSDPSPDEESITDVQQRSLGRSVVPLDEAEDRANRKTMPSGLVIAWGNRRYVAALIAEAGWRHDH